MGGRASHFCRQPDVRLFRFQNIIKSCSFANWYSVYFVYSYSGIGIDGIVPKECALSIQPVWPSWCSIIECA